MAGLRRNARRCAPVIAPYGRRPYPQLFDRTRSRDGQLALVRKSSNNSPHPGKQRQMTLAEIEQAKHAASWLNSLATNLATTGASLDHLYCRNACQRRKV